MGEDLFNMNNILTADEISSYFDDSAEDVKQETQPETKEEKESKTEEKITATETKESEDLFDDESESVGSEENKQEKEDTESTKDGDSPNPKNFYSSITEALVEEGVFPDLTNEDIAKVVSPEDFKEMFINRVKAEFDERTKRIDEALSVGVEPDRIKQYQTTIDYLDKISQDALAQESQEGENLRRKLLQQDFLNKGYSEERAVRMTQKLFDSGDDMEEAKLALEENRKFFNKEYQKIIDDAKAKDLEEKNLRKQLSEKLQKDIMNSSKVFGSLELDKQTRQKVFDNISRPIGKDPETGEYYTAIQKYRMENENDFIKNVGILFTLTDGFKNLSRLVQPEAKKEVKSKLKDLERTIRGASNGSTGTPKLVGLSEELERSFLDRGFKLDI